MKNTEIRIENIRIIRVLKGIKIDTMAKKLGVSKGEYSKIENNQRKDIQKYISQILTLLEIEEQHLKIELKLEDFLTSISKIEGSPLFYKWET